MHAYIRTALRGIALALCTAAASVAFGQGKEARIVVGNAPGGATDIVARLIAPKFAQALGEPVIVENKAGASGNIAADAVAKAAPDGRTLLLAFNSHATVGALFPKLPFDPFKDFASVGLIARAPFLVVAKPDIGVDNLKQALDRVKQTKKPLFMGSPGKATPNHLMLERLRKEEEVDVQVVHFKGTAPAITDVMGGHVDFTLATPSAAAGFVKAGKLKLLAVTSSHRLPEFPNTPTAGDLGIKSFADSGVWLALLAPAKTPRATVEKLNRTLNDVLRTPEVVEKLSSLGMTAAGGTPADLEKLMAEEQRIGTALIKELNITSE